MLKQIAWNTFKNTGDINTMMELMQVDKAAKNEVTINKSLDEKENIAIDILKNKNENIITKI